jgi:hypothetical protein
MRLLWRREWGQELVEFALVLPVLLLLMYGIVEFGRVIFVYNTLANAAREGARCGIIASSGCGGAPACVLHTTQAAGLADADVTVVCTPGDDTIEVHVSTVVTLIAGNVIQAVGGTPTISLQAVSTMRTE